LAVADDVSWLKDFIEAKMDVAPDITSVIDPLSDLATKVTKLKQFSLKNMTSVSGLKAMILGLRSN